MNEENKILSLEEELELCKYRLKANESARGNFGFGTISGLIGLLVGGMIGYDSGGEWLVAGEAAGAFLFSLPFYLRANKKLKRAYEKECWRKK